MACIVRMIKWWANYFGFVYVGRNKIPLTTLLGIKSKGINTVIDIGANKGQFSKLILKAFPNAIIYAFEPLPSAFNELNSWSKSLKSNQVITYNMAIGEKEGLVEMNFHSKFSPSSSILNTTIFNEEMYTMTQQQEKVHVQLNTLDKALEDKMNDLLEPVLIKIDVQGYEDRVLAGGEKVFSKAIGVILEVCLDSLYAEQAKFEHIVQVMSGFGFRYAGNLEQIYANDGHVVFFDAVFIK